MSSPPTRRRLAPIATFGAVALIATTTPALADSDDPIWDPLPDPAPSDLAITVEEHAQLPPSQPDPPPTDGRLNRENRINYLGEIPDGSGRQFVPDLNGMLYVLSPEGDVSPYLDVGGEFAPEFWDHQGLGSGFGFAAFHPDFAENGLFYTVHTEGRDALEEETPDLPAPDPDDVAHHGVITEWRADDPEADEFSGSQREVLRLGFETFIHGFQEINFNPTAEPGDADHGLLYLAVGDGGGSVTGPAPQQLDRPEGSILRVDPLGDDSGNGAYGIPGDNPFVDEEDALGEIYALGLRNPHRFSWDPNGDHRMFLANIGEWHIESVYEVRAGDNFGWADREGPFRVESDRLIYPLPEDDHLNGYTYPVAAYDHNREPGETGDLGVATVGGFVYRGDIGQLNGLYLFGDIVSGELYWTRAGQMDRESDDLAPIHQLRVLDADGNEVSMAELADEERVDLRFGIDAAGELYLLSKGSGSVWRITDASRV
ncbi:PQQ-dependent sugar dehydrogenase [Spiractinospora alimapuensis]|uniref:PQQ-dependent sugar dehydrogenase n=1 Tax=Spiractinospora alimapuensis TaxID=2820884 RepID=UPI001F35DBFF|nr:PQQ-dependent sugar dehydrogenase [Spiractinospora alimapuensis]QVQ53360.1 PQQ-dependent sugar dehydrogenase [Spiractinospora alimapuensis]